MNQGQIRGQKTAISRIQKSLSLGEKCFLLLRLLLSCLILGDKHLHVWRYQRLGERHIGLCSSLYNGLRQPTQALR